MQNRPIDREQQRRKRSYSATQSQSNGKSRLSTPPTKEQKTGVPAEWLGGLLANGNQDHKFGVPMSRKYQYPNATERPEDRLDRAQQRVDELAEGVVDVLYQFFVTRSNSASPEMKRERSEGEKSEKRDIIHVENVEELEEEEDELERGQRQEIVVPAS